MNISFAVIEYIKELQYPVLHCYHKKLLYVKLILSKKKKIRKENCCNHYRYVR